MLVSGNPIAYLKLLIVLYLGFVMLVAIGVWFVFCILCLFGLYLFISFYTSGLVWFDSSHMLFASWFGSFHTSGLVWSGSSLMSNWFLSTHGLRIAMKTVICPINDINDINLFYLCS